MYKQLLLTLLFPVLFMQPIFAQFPPACAPGEPPADNCLQTCVNCDFNGYSGTTAGYTPGNAQGFCGTIENDQWFGFIAGTSLATITITPSNCQNGNGVQLAIYDDCNGQPIPGGCSAGQQGFGEVPLNISVQLIPGKNYFLLVDGFAGDICEFSLAATPSNTALGQPVDSIIGNIDGPAMLCNGGTAQYTVPPVPNAGAYVWDAPSTWLINGKTPPATITLNDNGNSVQITAGFQSGDAQICVTAINACYNNGPSTCKTIAVSSISPTILPPLTVCDEDAPFEWQQSPYPVLSNPGTYSLSSTPYLSYLGCDSIVKQIITILPPKFVNLGTQFLCQGACFQLGDSLYCTAGYYVQMVTSYQGCDSMVTVILAPFNPASAAAIQAPQGQTITCLHPSLTLQSANFPNASHLWKNNAGDTIGMANSVTVSSSGYYFHRVKITTGSITCASESKILIKQNNTPPPFTAQGGTLDASHPTVQLVGNSIISGVTYAWTGPGGFTSNKRNPVVSVPGMYTLTVTNPQTGCSSSKTVVVLMMI